MTGAQDIPEQQMASCRKYLVDVLNTLLVALNAVPGADNRSVKRSIPVSILKRVRQEHKGTLSDYIKDVSAAKNQLLQDGIGLSEEDIQLLDELAATADRDMSEVFRRMWSKR